MKKYHLIDNHLLNVNNKKRIIVDAILILITVVLFYGCSTGNGSKEDYFGYNNNPNKNIRQEPKAGSQGNLNSSVSGYSSNRNDETSAGNDVAMAEAGKEEEWKNPLSDTYDTQGKDFNDTINVDKESDEKQSEQKQVVNYYFFNTYPHYIPVSVPWWWSGYRWYGHNFPRIYLYVGTPWYWWDYYWYDWYAPWYRYHPWFGYRWSYYNDYWDWHFYHNHHHWWDWDYYHHRHYHEYGDIGNYKKRTVRTFGPNRTFNAEDEDDNIIGTRNSSVGSNTVSRTNKISESNNTKVKNELKPNSEIASLNLTDEVFRTPVAVTGESPLKKENAVEMRRTRTQEKSQSSNSDNLSVKNLNSVFKESPISVNNNDVVKNSDKVVPNIEKATENKRTRIEFSDKKAESYRYSESKEKKFEKAPFYNDNYKPAERTRNIETSNKEKKVDKRASESGFNKALEEAIHSIFNGSSSGKESSSNNGSSSESSRSRKSSGSNESNRNQGSYEAPRSSGSYSSPGSSGSTRSSGSTSGSSSSSSSSGSERSRKTR